MNFNMKQLLNNMLWVGRKISEVGCKIGGMGMKSCKNLFEILNTYSDFFGWILSIIIWSSIHYFSAIGYAKWCTPYGFIGFINSIFYNESIHCKMMRYGIEVGSSTISYLTGLGFVFIGKRVIISQIPARLKKDIKETKELAR